MHEVIVFLADGFEEVEALTVVDLLRRAAIGVTTMSISTELRVKGSHSIVVEADALFDESIIDQAKILVLPGGMPGTNHLKDFIPLRDVLKKYQSKKVIAAICAAPIILTDLGILDDKSKATANPGFVDVLKNSNVSVVDESVVKDRHVITSRGLGTAIDFSLALIEHLSGVETVDKVKTSIVYQGE